MANYKETEEYQKLSKQFSEVYRSSLETSSSISTENLLIARNSLNSPQSHKDSFEFPSQQTIENYSRTYSDLEPILSYLEETSEKINIRDDYSFQPSSIILKVPKRRNTSFNSKTS